MKRPVVLGVLAAAAAVVAIDFFAATTFTGDDHLFLAFARHEPNPLAAFVSDRHGGEYYRPLPMALWWVLGRAGGGSKVPFAVANLALHVAAAVLTGALARATGRRPGTALVAATIFLVAPATREAALWFSASTDLLATTFTLGSILSLIRSRAAPDRKSCNGAVAVSVALALAGYLSKESALVLPALAALVLSARGARWSASAWAVTPHAFGALVYLIARWLVLGGWGGSGDPGPPGAARALQLVAGLVNALVGDGLLPRWLWWLVGVAGWCWLLAINWTGRRETNPDSRFVLLWIVFAVAPLPAAGWVVGARYFYLATVSVALLLAGALCGPCRWRRWLPGVGLSVLVALGCTQTAHRRVEISEYQARLDAAMAAVRAGAARGHRIFHIRSGIKDLDLVIKGRLDHRSHWADDLLILTDVPASFVMVPERLVNRAAFLLAEPPLPPSGAYCFGARKIVGLRRRDESPYLAEVIARLPEMRFIELLRDSRGRISGRDVTEAKKAILEPE